MSPFRKSLCAWSLAVGLIAANAFAVAANSDAEPTANYFEALRARALFVLAEDFATRQLGRSTLSRERRTQLTLELGETLLEHGSFASGSQREELWDAARQRVADLLRNEPVNPRQGDLKFWLARLSARQGATLAWESTLTPDDVSLRDSAITALRQGIAELRADIETRGRFAPEGDKKLAATVLREREIQNQRARYDLALAETCLAEISATGTERTALLIDAATLGEMLGRIPAEDLQSEKISLLRARIARLQGDERLARLLLSGANGTDADAVLAEQIRLELSLNKVDAAFQLLKTRLQETRPLSDELRAMVVQSLVTAARLAQQQQNPARLGEYLAEARKQQALTGGKWRREATVRLDRFQQEQELGPELAAAVRHAAAAWQSGQALQAADDYATATRLAAKAGKQDQALELGLTGASILVKNEAWAKAVSQLTELIRLAPQHPRAAEADLLRCYAIGRQNATSAEFQQALQDHLLRYSSSATRWDAVRMLGASAELQQRLPAAIAFYRQIPADHAARDEADLRTLSLLATLLTNSPQSTALATEAREEVIRSATRIRAQTTPWSAAQCEILLQGARLLLSPALATPADAERLLGLVQIRIDNEQEQASRQQAELSPEWKALKQSTLQLRIIALAGQQKLDEARQLLQTLKSAEPTLLLSVLSSLNAMAGQIDPQRRYELGHLQLQTIQELHPHRDRLNPDQQRLLDLATAEAATAVGNWSEAIDRYQTLLAAAPSDGKLIRSLIDVSKSQGLPADLKRAAELWQQLEKLAATGSPEWIEARIEQSALLLQMGDRAAARKLLGVTRTLYPQMGTPELRQRGDALWEQLK
ncbi:hypothetical protein [Planctomicrobium piriforme]|uniref:Tetratricopeptide repeat-containing protein n=1 Tax=Planctomicrobium piriforme TaxID=1576369 RepID=A0A1I3DCY1_9PLAN|nr:hypothetical protein [Planctomicrobium piriforme]SFH84563.1 hypothetical protein SAMN05421753_103185 [Planctomicrobium piriforme]